MQTQYTVLNYRINLYFHEYKLAIEIEYWLRNTKTESIRKKTWLCIRVNPDVADFNICKDNKQNT